MKRSIIFLYAACVGLALFVYSSDQYSLQKVTEGVLKRGSDNPY